MYTYTDPNYEAKQVLKSLIRYTESGNATWRIIEYNPIGSLGRDIAAEEKESASVVCHTIKAVGVTPEGAWNVDIMESIYLLSGKGDISITLSDDFTESLLTLSANEEYDDCTAANIVTQFSDSPILMFAQVVLPVLAEAAAPVFNSYTWYKFHVPDDITPGDKRTLIFRLTKRLADECRISDFHRMVFDIGFREQLRAELL